MVVSLCVIRKNEYPLVERIMYLFMYVLRECIFFPRKFHFGSRGYSFEIAKIFLSLPPTPLGFFTHFLVLLPNCFKETFVAFTKLSITSDLHQQRFYLYLGGHIFWTVGTILRRGIVCHLKYKLMHVNKTSSTQENFQQAKRNSKNK